MKLNNIEILNPDSFVISPIEISKSQRTASGRKVKDIVAVKHNYNLSYDAIDMDDLDVFISAFDIGTAVAIEYIQGNMTIIKQVFIESISRDVYQHDYQYSKKTAIQLEEV